MNAFKQLLHHPGLAHAPHQRVPLGTWITSASPLVAEAIGYCGFDWAVIDMEHAPLDVAQLVGMLQAVSSTKLVPIVRPPWNDAVVIKRVLDAGATTVIVPFVQNASEARAAVAATRYPPQGIRGMAGTTRASRFGTAPRYLQTANETMGVIVQLETPTALAALEAIAEVEGVDALFIGPADLSAAMGHVGDQRHPEVLDAIGRAVDRARSLGKPIGTLTGTPAQAAQARAMGFDFVGLGTDLALLVNAAQQSLDALRTQDVDMVHTLSSGTRAA